MVELVGISMVWLVDREPLESGSGQPANTNGACRHAEGSYLFSGPGCPFRVKCKGLCGTHYERQRKGHPLEGEIRRYTQQDITMLAAGFRVCTGPCALKKPLSEFAKTKAMCKQCLT